MSISILDYLIIAVFLLITLILGLYAARKAKNSTADYFLSGRSMPWWLLGVSMVATTFSADTPALVTDIVRKHGVGGNWVWWAFLLTGMTTVFIYAKLWRRAGISTDLEFYELRYSGKAASFLRGFRAVYLGLVFNVIIMATVLLAGIKIGGVMLDLSPLKTVLLVSVVTLMYSSVGGLRAVILTDFFQFIVSMIGMVAASIFIISMPEIGHLDALFAHELVKDGAFFMPDFTDPEIYVPLFLIPIAVQWWSVWYPGAEPGGGGYVAQRMLSAKDEKEAVWATLLFNIAHYALRPWPWILIALASLVFYPDVASLAAAFPNIKPELLTDDLAFPAMMTHLPKGLLGLVLASLIAALMSTISTHLNWGASYLVNDLYRRFIVPSASERELVRLGRLSTVFLMVIAAIVALFMKSALDSFNIILQIGAGTGLIFILRWFWWRINAYSEIAAMTGSFLIAVGFEFFGVEWLDYEKMIFSIVASTIIWVLVTFLTRPTETKTLTRFYTLIRPYSYGWQAVKNTLIAEELNLSIESSLGRDVLKAFLGCVLVYSSLFTTAYFLYGQTYLAFFCLAVVVLSILGLRSLMKDKF